MYLRDSAQSLRYFKVCANLGMEWGKDPYSQATKGIKKLWLLKATVPTKNLYILKV